MIEFRVRVPCLFVLTTSLLVGCVSQRSQVETRYFLLEPPSSQEADAVDAAHARGLRIALGPVAIAEYLDQPRMVTRRSDHEVVLQEYARWAMPLAGNISEVLRETLRQQLPGSSTSRYPSLAAEPFDVRVALEVLRLDNIRGERVELLAIWQVFGADGKVLAERGGRAELRGVPAGPDIADLVRADALLLEQLAARISARLDGIAR